MSPPDDRILHRRSTRDIDDEARDGSVQIEASFEAVGEGNQAGLRVLEVLQRAVAADLHGLGLPRIVSIHLNSGGSSGLDAPKTLGV